MKFTNAIYLLQATFYLLLAWMFGLFAWHLPLAGSYCLSIHGPVNTSVAMTVSPPVTSATEQGFWAEGDNLCAKDAVKFLHDSDDYSFDDSFDFRIDFTIASIVLTY